MSRLLLIILFASFIAFDSEILRLEANEISNANTEPKTALTSSISSETVNSNDGLKSKVDSNKLDQVEKDKEELGKVKEVDKSERDHSKEQLESVTGQDRDSRKEMKKKKGLGEADVMRDKGLESQKEETGDKDVTLKKKKQQQQLQVSPSEDCDPSNRCAANDNALIACLRVPGSDQSSDLSLLIQNKGKEGLQINISAPSFVGLEKTQVHLLEKENIKVKVSITKSGNNNNKDNLIILSAGNNGDCSLDIKDLVAQYSKEKEVVITSKFTQMVFIRRNPIIVSVLLVCLLLVTLVCTYVSFRKRRLGSMSLIPKYQRLDEEVLPVVSSGRMEQSESNDGWDDNGWGDNWDDVDEEAAPTIPLTPSFSSKGFASRKINKDGWKD